MYTQSKDDKVVFYSANSPLSSHYPSPFKHDGESFNSAEQYIMASKASFFNDQESVQAIMKEKDPKRQKQIGKSIKNFDAHQWQSNAKDIVTPGIMSKFEQCKKCKEFLLNTGSKSIYEANPHDKFFGIGVSMFSPSVWDTTKHKGQNLMGKILEDVRSKIDTG